MMKTFALLFFFTLLCAQQVTAQTTLIPYGNTWKYLDNGSNQGTAWRSSAFNDSGWKTGNGKFGYGLSGLATTVSYGPDDDNKFITTYFRKAVSITNAGTFTSFTVNAYREDGIVVYVNGVEVYRNNMPTGTIAYNTLAASSPSNDGATPVSFTVSTSRFINGTNVIAAEIHQRSKTSSDILFDLSLVGNGSTANPAPSVSSMNRYSPSSPTTATSVTFRATFSERVNGVDAADFAVARVSGTVTGTVGPVTPQGTGGNIFDVTVSGITGTGELRLDLKSTGTGITDVDGNPITGGYTAGQTFVIQSTTSPTTTTYGFASLSNLNPVNISKNTSEKPQAKVWTHDGRWWTVLPSSGETKIFRLDGTTWTPVLTLYPSDARADCRVVGNVVHILLFRGPSTSSYLVSAEYDSNLKTYKLWNQRPARVSLPFGSGTETATLDIDGTGRMWIASCGTSNVTVRWSDAPYATWSAPVTIGSGILDDDICAITTLPGKIGVLWSNQNTERFHFRTHTDGDSPATWSADELPAAASAKNAGSGMADDHLNIVRASDGTLYCAVKTGYDTEGYPTIALLVRRPSGSWDPLYPVTITQGSTHNGTRGIVVLNEALGKVKVVYTSVENGGDILYRESSLSSISFGQPRLLLRGNFNNATSTHQTYTNEIVILATDQSKSPYQAAGVLAFDETAPVSGVLEAEAAAEAEQLAVRSGLPAEFSVAPNPVMGNGQVRFTLPEAGAYTLTLYNLAGTRLSVVKQGRAEAGQQNTVSLDASGLTNGVYLIRLQTSGGSKTLKLAVRK